MYTIKVDGQVIWSPALAADDDQYKILSPALQLEVDSPGSLTFTLPPGHMAHDSIQEMKSTITMEWDGVEIFRGRALEEKSDTYNQKEIYCEGDLSYLLDSVQRPFAFSGTTRAYIEQALATHNAQVDAYKHFTMGNMSGLTDDTTLNLEGDGYTDTLSAIRTVLSEHEGYLCTRYENGVRYLDYVKSSGANNGQAIEFGVNLLDLDQKAEAGEICTVLLPIGGMLENGTTVTIASVNNGSDTIENAEAIAQYGRIVKTYSFDDVIDPAELLKLAQEKLQSMTIGQTLTLKAVDMHLLDKEKGMILPGVPVLIHTLPHGIDKEDICTSADINPESPEKSVYTFGEPAETQSGAAAMIANTVRIHTKTVQQLYKHYYETDYKVKIQAGLLDSHDKYLAEAKIELDGINAQLLLKADKTETTALGNRLSQAEVAIDGAYAAITLKASQEDVNKLKGDVEGVETRLSAAEIAIDGANAAINLKASQTTVDEMGKRISDAEIAIDGANSRIDLKADLVALEGYVTMEEFEATNASISNLTSGLTTAAVLSANLVKGTQGQFTYFNADSFNLNHSLVSSYQLTMGDVTSGTVLSTGGAIDLAHSHEVTVNDDGTITLGEVSSSGGSFKIADTKAYKDGVSASYGNGYNTGFADGKAAYLPTAINRTGYDMAAKTVTVRALNSHQDLLTGQVIDASPIYDHGYSEGDAAGYTRGHGEGYTAGDAAGHTRGWNECRDNMTAISCIIPTSTVVGELFYANGQSAGTGFYRGTSTTLYTKPAAI